MGFKSDVLGFEAVLVLHRVHALGINAKSDGSR